MSETKEGQPVGCMRPSMVFGAVSSDTLEDVLLDLAKQNERSLSSLSQHSGCFKETRIIEFIFLLSEQWHLDNSARYQAVEILERFMIKHIEDVYTSAVMAQKDGDKAPTDNWTSFKVRCREIFLLRLVSCVQIASKLSFHCSVINNTTVLKFLQSLGYMYSKEELLESELTILKALQFQMNVATPCPYVEMLLEVLGHNGCELPMKHLHDICLKILDLVYLLRNSIYETLLRAAVENSSPSELQRLAQMDGFMLLCQQVETENTLTFGSSTNGLCSPIYNQSILSLQRVEVDAITPLRVPYVMRFLISKGDQRCLVEVLVSAAEGLGILLLLDIYDRVMFLSVKEDLMLLATGIIAASAFILNHECWSQVLEHLNCITGITVESILELSTAILNHSIGTTTPRKH